MVNYQFAFALHIMTALAYFGRIIDSRTLARSVNTNPVVVRRVLLALRRARLIRTHAGKNGGAELNKSPASISLHDIYEAVLPPPVICPRPHKTWRHCP